MVSKLFFSFFSFLYLFSNPHKSFHIGEESIKIFFLLFECEINMYMLTCIFLTLE
jgi:hypothetical protein